MFGFFKKRRRRRARAHPFPGEWQRIIAKNIGFWESLDAEERDILQGHILVFLDEKSFEGCQGFEVTDEVRVTVAAQACLLLLRREADFYPNLKLIYIYPAAYLARSKRWLPDGTVVDEAQVRLGESWRRGSVVLNWDDTLAGAERPRDGSNLVFHEFAHQIDDEAGGHDGAPRLKNRERYAVWSQVLGKAFEKLVEDVARGRRTAIDPYGATNPAEFFAVVTEEFFEQPLQLERKHAELYEQFKIFYGQDPLERLRRASGAKR